MNFVYTMGYRISNVNDKKNGIGISVSFFLYVYCPPGKVHPTQVDNAMNRICVSFVFVYAHYTQTNACNWLGAGAAIYSKRHDGMSS